MSFYSHSAQMLFYRFISIAIGTTIAILLARLLGPADRGVLAMLVLSISLASLFLQFGFPETIIYIVGSKVFPNDQVTSTIIVYFLIIIALFSIPASYCMNWYWHFSTQKNILLVLATSVSILLTTMRHFLLARQQFRGYGLSILLENIIYLFGILVIWGFFSVSVDNALIAYVLSMSLAFTLILVLQLRNGFSISLKHIRPQIITKCFQHGYHLFIAGIGGFGAQRINYYILESLVGMRAVGLFVAAGTIPTLFANLPQQLGTVIYSHVANSESNDQGTKVTLKVFKVVALLSAFCMLPVAVFSKEIVTVFFGKEFSDIHRVLVILSIGMTFIGLSGILYNALAGIGLHKFGSRMAFVNIFLISALAFLLVPTLGVEGAALAQMVAAFVNLLYMLWIYSRQFRLSIKSLLFLSKAEWSLLLRPFAKIVSL